MTQGRVVRRQPETGRGEEHSIRSNRVQTLLHHTSAVRPDGSSGLSEPVLRPGKEGVTHPQLTGRPHAPRVERLQRQRARCRDGVLWECIPPGSPGPERAS